MGIGAGLNAAGIGIGGTLLLKFLAAGTWTLINIDSKEALQGQFPTEDNGWDVGANYAEITSLGRQNPILQFLNGAADRLTMKSRFRMAHEFDDSVIEKLNKLVSWARRDAKLGRPPILQFVLGEGDAINAQVVLTAVSGIKYANPSFTGSTREVTFSIHLLKYTEFSIDDEEVTDTRYHRTAQGETYELICQREYGDPMLGDVIRKQEEQNGKALLVPGDIVKLPAPEGVRDSVVTQTSIPLQTAYSRQLTDQKANRIAHFNRRNVKGNVYRHTRPQALVAGVATTAPLLWSGTEDGTTLMKIVPWHGARSVTTFSVYGAAEGIAYDAGIRSGNKQVVFGEIGNDDRDGIVGFDCSRKCTNWPKLFSESSNYVRSICVDALGYYWVIHSGFTYPIFKYDPLNVDGAIENVGSGDSGTRSLAGWIFYQPDDDRVYCISSYNREVICINPNDSSYWKAGNFYSPSSGAIIRRLPASGTDPRQIWVAHADVRMTPMDIDTQTQGSTWYPAGGNGLRGLAYDPVRDKIWATNYFANQVLCLDPATLSVVATIDLPNRPHEKAIMYEPASSGAFGTSGDRIWFTLDTSPTKIYIVDPDNPTEVEEILDGPSVTPSGSNGLQFAYMPASDAVVDLEVSDDGSATMSPETWGRQNIVTGMSYPWIAAHYRAGTHNTISAGRIDVVKDLSSYGRDLTPYGSDPDKRPYHIDSVTQAKGAPGIRFTGTEHMVGTGFTLTDLITLASTYTGYRAGDSEYFWALVYRRTYFPANRLPIIGCWETDANGYGMGFGCHDAYNNLRIDTLWSYEGILTNPDKIIGTCTSKTAAGDARVYTDGYAEGSPNIGGAAVDYGLTRPFEMGNAESSYFTYGGFQGDIFEVFLCRRCIELDSLEDFFTKYARQTYGTHIIP